MSLELDQGEKWQFKGAGSAANTSRGSSGLSTSSPGGPVHWPAATVRYHQADSSGKATDGIQHARPGSPGFPHESAGPSVDYPTEHR